MAVHECISLKFMDSCDDDGHVFRSSSSKQNQAESPMKSQSQTTGQSPGKALSQQLPNGENTYSRRNKNISSTNSVAAKHSLTSEINLHDRLAAFVNKPHAETSNSDAPIAKHTPSHKSNLIDKQHAFVNSHSEAANSDDSDDNKPLRFKKTASTSKTSGSLPLSVADDNCDDDKPLSSGSVINSSRVHGSLQTKIPSNPQKTALKNKDGSSVAKDQKSSKLLVRPNVLPDSNELSDSDEKPLLDRFKQNGSSKSEPGTSGKAMPNSKKRSSIGDSNSHLSSKKKTKLSEVSVNDVKKKPVLKELKASKADKDDYDDDDDGDDDGGDDDDYVPIMQRVKKTVSPKNRSSAKKSLKKINKTSFKKKSKESKKDAKKYKEWKLSKVPPGSGEGQKWTTLEHNGVIFPTPYKPHGIKMLYNGQPVDLSPEQEEVATMFAVMKDTEYATKTAFIANFMNDWRAILGKNHVVKKFELCDFTPIYEWHSREKEKKKQMTSEEKKALKEEKMRIEEKYMWAIVDGVKEKVGNFRVEPPGLFRGRGEHPKMGKLKKRIRPQDITINIGKDAPIPECPISGERWKEVRHDNTVTWLAYWNDPINSKELKYVFLAASSSLKGQSDKEKYEKARKLKDYILSIRARYTKDLASKDDTRRQIAVATYLIDKLALRAGNEKDDDEADTVGCCTLKVEHVTLVPPNKLQFDFLGKDSIRYFNTVEVDPPVYKAIGEFQKGGKKGADDLFDKLDTAKLNAHLKELMPGLTAKVFRTYNASITLDDMLNGKTKGDNVPEKIAVYQSANKEVAIICNHQRSVSKNHDTQMSRLDEKIDELKSQQEELEVDLGRAKKGKPPLNDADGKPKRNLAPEAIQRKLAQLATKIEKMELDRKIKEDLKTVALGTSKINYLDPRISVAWCKRNEVPIEKIFNKSLLAKFAWAMDVEPSFRF